MELIDKKLTTKDGCEVLDCDYVQSLRDTDKKRPNHLKIIAQLGGQEKLLSTNADITIYGGMRGGGKSYALLMEALKDVKNKFFRSVVMRHEINDLSDIIETSYQIYVQYGKYNKSKNDMTWNFDKGGFLEFSYHADSVEDFKTRFQGHQYSYVGVDEITHMDYPKFKYMITCNRNAFSYT
ncbi:terminase large subunit domain-containing protein [Bacteroides sp. 14(A)]|uniref:terminase large subunit domain-containing protein n=1 Tax=Bacteroides sp. 14(A) TaxID=1163670 RepID=UPI002101B307|nr:terminase family protein [Bacteroides sp. 14(A)]